MLNKKISNTHRRKCILYNRSISGKTDWNTAIAGSCLWIIYKIWSFFKSNYKITKTTISEAIKLNNSNKNLPFKSRKSNSLVVICDHKTAITIGFFFSRSYINGKEIATASLPHLLWAAYKPADLFEFCQRILFDDVLHCQIAQSFKYVSMCCWWGRGWGTTLMGYCIYCFALSVCVITLIVHEYDDIPIQLTHSQFA